MKTHIFTTVPNSYQTTIQILEQWMLASIAQQGMDVIRAYAKWMTLTIAIGDASSGVALYFNRGNHGHGHDGGVCGQGGRQWSIQPNALKKYKCTYCKMDYHTTTANRQWQCTEINTHNIDTTTSRNDKQTCYHCGLPEHLQADCNHFKHARDQCNKQNQDIASITTARDRDLIWLADDAPALTTASAPVAEVIDFGASHHVCNDHTRFNSIKKLRQPIVIELGDDNKVTVSHHGLINISQEYKYESLHTPTFRLSLLFINQLDTTRYTSKFGCSKWSISLSLITITSNQVNDLYIMSVTTALTLAVPCMSMKSASE